MLRTPGLHECRVAGVHRPAEPGRRAAGPATHRLAGTGRRAVLPGHHGHPDGHRPTPAHPADRPGGDRGRGRRARPGRGRRGQVRGQRGADGGPGRTSDRSDGRHRGHHPGRAGPDHPCPARRDPGRGGWAGLRQDRRGPAPRGLPAVHAPRADRAQRRPGDRPQSTVPALHQPGAPWSGRVQRGPGHARPAVPGRRGGAGGGRLGGHRQGRPADGRRGRERDPQPPAGAGRAASAGGRGHPDHADPLDGRGRAGPGARLTEAAQPRAAHVRARPARATPGRTGGGAGARPGDESRCADRGPAGQPGRAA